MNAGSDVVRCPVTLKQIVKPGLQGHDLVVLDPLVAINKRERQEIRAQIKGVGPGDMPEHPLGQGRIAGQFLHPGRPKLAVIAAVADGVGLGQIVEQGGRPNFGYIDGKPGRLGQMGQGRGHAGHKPAVFPDVWQHVVGVPQPLAFLVAGDSRDTRPVGHHGRGLRRIRRLGRVGPGSMRLGVLCHEKTPGCVKKTVRSRPWS